MQIETLIRGGDDDPLAETESLPRPIGDSTTLGVTSASDGVDRCRGRRNRRGAHFGDGAAQAGPTSPGSTSRCCRRPEPHWRRKKARVVSPDGVAWRLSDTTPVVPAPLRSARSERATHAEPLAKTEGASLPFWSPDSRAIGFFAQGSLKTIDIFTGGARSLAPAGGPRGGTWSRDGVIVFVPSPRAGPYRISAAGDGGDQTPVPSETEQPPGGWFPSFLPDGRHFLEFVPTVKQPENSGVWVVSLESGKRQRLVDSQSNAIYSAGSAALLAGRNAWAQAFDETQLVGQRQPESSG